MRLLMALAVLGLSITTGCASMKGKDAYTDYAFMRDGQYKEKKALKRPLIKLKDGRLSDESIQALLKSRVVAPAKVNVAVVRLKNYEGFELRPLDDQVSEKFYTRKNWGPRVQSVMPVPEILLQNHVTLDNLRSTAALMRADLLIIISPTNAVDSRFSLFDETKAKARTNLDVLLMDVRTGAIPFTYIASEQAEIPKDRKDYSTTELMQRAILESEKKAHLALMAPITDFINTAL